MGVYAFPYIRSEDLKVVTKKTVLIAMNKRNSAHFSLFH